MKLYTKSKKIEEGLGSVYMEYLSALEDQQMITFSKDPVYKENKLLNLKFAGMFLNRFVDELKKQK